MISKTDVTSKEIRQYATCLCPGDVGEYVLLPGDPARCDRTAKYFDDAKLVANNREHRTFTGFYKGIKVSVTSTGMGCPSAAIATEELSHVGAKVFIRIGSSAAIHPQIKVGDLIISSGSMKNEGTSRFFVPDAFPAVPDMELTHLLVQTARSMVDESVNVHTGIGSTDDGFFGETPEFISRIAGYGCINLEMEGSGIFTVARRLHCRAAAIYGCSSNLVSNEIYYADGTMEKENTKLVNAWDTEIRIALETICRFDRIKDTLGMDL